MVARPVQLKHARRLFLTRQRLAGPRAAADGDGILEIARALRCLQLDPTSAVARSHLLVLWSRIGNFDPSVLEHLAYEERRFFEYWAHQASLVLSEDYPIHHYGMRANIRNAPAWHERTRAWIEANKKLRNHIVRQLRAHGPLRARDIEDVTEQPWKSSGWTNERNVGRMLDLLSVLGVTLVSRREGGQKLWDLGERCLPENIDRKVLPEHEIVRQATNFAVAALGVARPAHIKEHFTRGRYPDLPLVLEGMVKNEELLPIEIKDGRKSLKGPWFMRTEDVPLLEEIERGAFRPRTTLLSPFDNLICGRDRTEEMFGFRFRLEIYTPKPKRQYGFFVMPIVYGDRLIGRVDPTADRKSGTLRINAVHLEPGAPSTKTVAASVGRAVANLARFVGAERLEYGKVPAAWKNLL